MSSKSKKMQSEISYEEFESFIVELLRAKKNNEKIAIPFIKDQIYSLSSSTLKEYFKKTELYNPNSNNNIYSTGNVFEVAVLFFPNYSEYTITRKYSTISDPINKLDYHIGSPSPEYTCYILRQLYLMTEKKYYRKILLNHRHVFLYLNDVNNTVTDEIILSALLGVKTLRIDSEKSLKEEDWDNIKQAFMFDFSFHTGLGLIEQSLLEDITQGTNDYRKGLLSRPKTVEPPKRIYDNVLVDYYKKGMLSEDPFVQYISFYHVLEHCYDREFKRRLINNFKNAITEPGFRYNNDEQLYQIAIELKNYKMDKNNHPNESSALQYVIEEYIDLKQLISRIKEIVGEDIKRYGNPISFFNNNDKNDSKVDFDQIDNPQNKNACSNIITSLYKRIYATRNALVHSKERENESNYKVFEDENELRKEIPLIRAVAEQIIIKTGKILE